MFAAEVLLQFFDFRQSERVVIHAAMDHDFTGHFQKFSFFNRTFQIFSGVYLSVFFQKCSIVIEQGFADSLRSFGRTGTIVGDDGYFSPAITGDFYTDIEIIGFLFHAGNRRGINTLAMQYDIYIRAVLQDL